jgi:hypothetical protein
VIEVRAADRPSWAKADAQLATLLEDLAMDTGARDREVMDAFDAALDELDGEHGLLGRQLVPAIVRTDLPDCNGSCLLRLPPVLEVVGIERQDSAGLWFEDEAATWSLDGSLLTYRAQGGHALRAVAHHGYLDADVPPKLKVALRLMVRQLVDGHNDKRQVSIDRMLVGLKVYG